MSRYAVEVESQVERQLRRIPEADQQRIYARMATLADNPRPAGCEKLQAQIGLWRIRSGDYRIVYRVVDEERVVIVTRVGHRRDIYRS